MLVLSAVFLVVLWLSFVVDLQQEERGRLKQSEFSVLTVTLTRTNTHFHDYITAHDYSLLKASEEPHEKLMFINAVF